MHKSKTLQKAKNTDKEMVYLTVKTRTGFDVDIVKCVILVKTSKEIFFQSRTCIFESHSYFQNLDKAQIFFNDAIGSNYQKLIQLPLF